MKLRHLPTLSLIPTSLLVASCSAPGSNAPDPAAQDPGLAVSTQADDPTPARTSTRSPRRRPASTASATGTAPSNR